VVDRGEEGSGAGREKRDEKKDAPHQQDHLVAKEYDTGGEAPKREGLGIPCLGLLIMIGECKQKRKYRGSL